MSVHEILENTGCEWPIFCSTACVLIARRCCMRFWCRATKALGGMVVDAAVPTFGLKGVRSWLDKRAEKRVAKLGPVPAPTPPLPWEYFRRMPRRLPAARHRNFRPPAGPGATHEKNKTKKRKRKKKKQTREKNNKNKVMSKMKVKKWTSPSHLGLMRRLLLALHASMRVPSTISWQGGLKPAVACPLPALHALLLAPCTISWQGAEAHSAMQMSPCSLGWFLG